MNGKSVEGYPNFVVTAYYKENREIIEGQVKIIRPEILVYSGNMFTCEYDDIIVHNFPYVEGNIRILF